MMSKRKISGARANRGFTLIELMITIAIITIMSGMAIGFSGTWRRRTQMREVARELYNGANRARAEAISPVGPD